MPQITTLVARLKLANAAIIEYAEYTDPEGNLVPASSSIDWVPALKLAAQELQALNGYVGTLGINPETGEDYFPRPISCNPDAMVWVAEHEEDVPEIPEQIVDGEVIPAIPATTRTVPAGYQGDPTKFLGDAHGWPSEKGFLTIQLHNYEYLELGYLPAQPTTFTFTLGVPEGTATYI